VAFKKTTILLVPDATNRVKRFKVPSFLPVFFGLILVSCAAFLVFIIRDYQSMKIHSPQLVRLEKENELQKRQLDQLAKRIDQTTKKLYELKEFDRKLRIMVNLETSEGKKEFQGVGGSDPILFQPQHNMAKTHKDLVRSMHSAIDNLDSEIALCEKDKTELHKFLENQKVLLASTPSIWPTKGWLSSRFGYRISPFTGKKEFHRGIDIATRMGAPIVAPADGIVLKIYSDHGYGKVLAVSHGYGVITRYAHLNKALVKKGQYVKRGETIALVGNSGRSTGPHLHYEVHLNRVAVDPLRYVLN
jgi:murein DD-endopeptidase MepM/ murein hydrolase activator NlpD